ncbi:class I SAM-dependent methyltransferase [Pseudoramibacter faecis]|uniref:class I SAM-dependent methyltransferase n=1 Tax=Pseudoramibacter faecis TaxID=3108534 RepID=UPI002E76D9C1|nr:class I SAM-dependent methyltransferase [Pseudoramibacter sp. HA2172]
MFWDNVAGVYDVFVNVINRKTHRALRQVVADLINPEDDVLECACGTGMLSSVIASKCRKLTAMDYSNKMLKRAEKNYAAYRNISFRFAGISALDCPDSTYDKVVAGNVIHLLDEPIKALDELNRVCKPGGVLIIPTYINKDRKGKNRGFSSAVGKAGADFKRQFTPDSYRQFFLDAGYEDVKITLADGRIPCAVAVMKKIIR